MADNKDDDLSRWKNKYFDLMSEQEKQTTQSGELLDILRRALVRVSLVADNQDSGLDNRLGELRKFLRGQDNLDDVVPFVDKMETAFKKFESRQESDKVKVQSQLESSLKQWEQLDELGENKSLLKSLKKQYPHLLEQNSCHLNLLSEFISLSAGLVTQLTPDQETASEAKGGFFSKLFNKPEEKTNPAFSQKHNLDISQESTQLDKDEPVYSAVAVEIRGILQRLMSQLSLPAEGQDSLSVLDKKIEKGLNWYELVPALDELVGLVMLALGSSQAEFEAFLMGLNGALAEVQQQLLSAADEQKHEQKSAQRYEDNLRNKVQILQTSVLEAQDLDGLKSAVKTQVTTLLDFIGERRVEECSREQALEKQLNALNAQISQMEVEAEAIKADVIEQHAKAITDHLTQLPNRQAYQEWLSKELPRIKRYDTDLTLLVADIDHFKMINDNYGHLAGDKVLQILAQTLATSLREPDFICRFGGEEFIILMPETSGTEALTVAEKLRKKVGLCPFHFSGEPVSIHMSFGITQFGKDEEEAAVFERADKALYQAKNKGRNCCVLVGQ